jgi:hypothetical protein
MNTSKVEKAKAFEEIAGEELRRIPSLHRSVEIL